MIGLLTPLLLLLAQSPTPADDLRLDQIQVIGTHNSYHLAPHPAVAARLALISPDLARSIAYTHRPIPEQLERLGVRQLELDVFADPEGGLFSRPMLPTPPAQEGEVAGFDPPALALPGLKVLHVQDVDYRTTVPTFALALRQIRDWSTAHPRHVPILVLVELKDEAHTGLSRPIPIDEAAIREVDATISDTFVPGKLITPDSIRGGSDTLPNALRARGWPRLRDARGKLVFALDNGGRIRDLYLDRHPALEGRAMFVDSPSPDHPAAAWFKRNDPEAAADEIRRLVLAGFLVRTRADADTIEARTNNPTRRDAALASGAQFISTDYPEADPALSDYRVRLPGHVAARPNPVTFNGPDGFDLNER